MNLRAPGFWQAAPKTSLRAGLLAPLGALYHGEVQRRLAMAKPYRASCPVVCVGNATMGGVGKTPFVRMLANELEQAGHRPHILTRGYGGSLKGPVRVTSDHAAKDVGDEPLMLASDFPVWVSRDRVLGAKAAADAGASVIVMDDGLQNPHLAKDRSLLLVDADSLFGNEEVFPAGPLRERPEAARARTHAVISVLANQDQKTPDSLRAFAGHHPVAEAWFGIDAATIPHGPLIAFCGIGGPERFEASLRSAGADIAAFRAFADHHAFKSRELKALTIEAEAKKAALVTTEKDFVRLAPQDRTGITPIPGRMRWRGGDAILRLIQEIL
ncbi:MAG: tetraacyldisaccharide 4'-kinase [Pseudomonadota bacterium]